MIRRDPAQILIWRMWSDATKEHPYLELPLLQVGSQQRWLVVIC